METLKQIGSIIVVMAKHTPWWVYVLFVYLMFIGIQALKESIKPVKVTLIMPIIFTWMSIDSIIALSHLNTFYATLTYTLSLILIGCTIGFIVAKKSGVCVDKKNQLLKLPGTWFTLISILLIFIIKYYFHYKLALNPSDATTEYHFIAASGVITGLFIGRVVFYFLKLKQGPWENLGECK